MCVYVNTNNMYLSCGCGVFVCMCAACQLNVILNFLESVLGMSYAMQAHSYREYILPFKFGLH